MPQPPISLRQALPRDLTFVRSSWFESYRKGGLAPDVGFDVYKPGQDKLITRLTGAFVTVAYATDVPDEICGWVCADFDAIHYVYVKQAYRRLGIATTLAKAYSPKTYTHETRAGRKLASKLGIRYNPYSLYLLPKP